MRFDLHPFKHADAARDWGREQIDQAREGGDGDHHLNFRKKAAAAR